jgi:flagellar basal-body rod protein FlgF
MDGNSTYLGLSHQLGLSGRLNVISNNVANTTTDGFLRQTTRFESAVQEISGDAVADPDGTGQAAFPVDRATILDVSSGPVRQTGNPLDVATDDRAFFAVRGEDGSRLYTRNGHLELAGDGTLRHAASGRPVLNQNGGELVVPQDAGEIEIAKDGTVTTADGVVVGEIGTFRVPGAALMEPRGETLYAATDQSGQGAPSDSRVAQGAIEGSNVEPIRQMANLIDVQRAYGRGTQMNKTLDDQATRTIRTLGKTS